MRAKAVAEAAVVHSRPASTVFAPSIIYAPNDPYVTLLERTSWLPVMPIPATGPRLAPIWPEDVADGGSRRCPAAAPNTEAIGARYELAGPEILIHRQIVGSCWLPGTDGARIIRDLGRA